LTPRAARHALFGRAIKSIRAGIWIYLPGRRGIGAQEALGAGGEEAGQFVEALLGGEQAGVGRVEGRAVSIGVLR
jgi:hypothetical protein